MQKTQDDSSEHAGAPAPARAKGLQSNSEGIGIVWVRSDWNVPVGAMETINFEAKESQLEDQTFHWVRSDIPELLLFHRAALFVLQGLGLSTLLLTNHRLVSGSGPIHPGGLASFRLLLKTDRFEPWGSTPKLTNLVLASWENIPKGMNDAALNIMVADVLGRT